MNLAIVLAAILPLAAPPEGPVGGRLGESRETYVTVQIAISNQGVQKELKFDERQTRCRELVKRTTAKHNETFPTFLSLDPAEKKRKTEELMKALLEEMNEGIAGILTPEQSQRFRQIRLQFLGHGTFLAPSVQDARAQRRAKAADEGRR